MSVSLIITESGLINSKRRTMKYVVVSRHQEASQTFRPTRTLYPEVLDKARTCICNFKQNNILGRGHRNQEKGEFVTSLLSCLLVLPIRPKVLVGYQQI